MCLNSYGITTPKYSTETAMITVKCKKKNTNYTQKKAVLKSSPIQAYPWSIEKRMVLIFYYS